MSVAKKHETTYSSFVGYKVYQRTGGRGTVGRKRRESAWQWIRGGPSLDNYAPWDRQTSYDNGRATRDRVIVVAAFAVVGGEYKLG